MKLRDSWDLVIATVMTFTLVGVLFWGCFYNASRADFKCEVYRSGCVVMDNGNEYRPAEVVEVDGNEVTVKIGRDLYAFRGKNFSVGQRIICEITTDDEIIDVMR